MKKTVYRNLDRPFTLFGIKGSFLGAAGIGIGGILITSILIGTATNTFIGLGVAVVCIAGGYLALAEIQQKFGQKSLNRKFSGLNIPHFIRVNSKIWKR